MENLRGLNKGDVFKKISATVINAYCDIKKLATKRTEWDAVKGQMQYIINKCKNDERYSPSLDQVACMYSWPSEVTQWKTYIYATCPHKDPSAVKKWGLLRDDSRELMNLHIEFRSADLEEKQRSLNCKIDQLLKYVEDLYPQSYQMFANKCKGLAESRISNNFKGNYFFKVL